MSVAASLSRLESRRAIVEAAWRCAAQKGFRRTSIEDLCTEAGVGRSTFLKYFTGKHDLLTALLDDDWALLEGVLYQLDMAPLSSAERLAKFVEVMLSVADDPARGRLRADLWTYVLTDEDLRVWAAQRMAGRRTMLRNWVDRLSLDMKAGDIPANAVSSVLLALCDGLILHSSADSSAFRWSNIRLAVEVLLDGLNVETTQTSRPVEPPAFRPAS